MSGAWAWLRHNAVNIWAAGAIAYLLIPIALRLGRQRTSSIITLLGVATLFSAWFGAYALAATPYRDGIGATLQA